MECRREPLSQVATAGQDNRPHPIVSQAGTFVSNRFGSERDSDRHDSPSSALLVKVPQVQRVIFRLLLCLSAVGFVLRFELQAEDDIGGQENSVDSLLSARDRIFEQQRPVGNVGIRGERRARRLQCGNLLLPSFRLLLLQLREAQTRNSGHEQAENPLRVVSQELGEGCSVEGWHGDYFDSPRSQPTDTPRALANALTS